MCCYTDMGDLSDRTFINSKHNGKVTLKGDLRSRNRVVMDYRLCTLRPHLVHAGVSIKTLGSSKSSFRTGISSFRHFISPILEPNAEPYANRHLRLFVFGIDRLSLLVGQDVGVTGIEDSHGAAAEELTAGSAELDLGLGIMVSIRT